AAAARGADVALLEQSAEIGGTVAHALIHTLGGLLDDQGEILNPGLTEELIRRLTEASPQTAKRRIGKTWTLSVDPAVYLAVVSRWLAEYPTITVFRHATVKHVSAEAGRITEVAFGHNGENRAVRPYALIDASGHAAVVRGLAAELAADGEALAGLIVQLRGVAAHALQFPKGVALLRTIRKAAETGDLSAECATLWLDSGVYADEAYIKFNLPAAEYDPLRMAEVARRLLAYLQAQPAFADAYISASGKLGIRDGGRVQGEYVLTEDDLRQGRHFDDAVCAACWPIEYWHPQHGVSLEYFPPGQRYQIPLRALTVKGFTNLYVAGKCFSAEPLALASARVAGSCWAMGEGLVKSLFQET
ncbi:MAG: FAD-dependent oxidoreductase, partial [Candidatus Methylumidiphilus sp.]